MNNEILKQAVDHYDDYTIIQKKIIKMFIDMAIKNVVVITPVKIVELSQATRATVYSSIKRFQEDGLITLTNPTKNGKFTKFNINQDKLDEILQRFEMQRNYQNQQNV